MRTHQWCPVVLVIYWAFLCFPGHAQQQQQGQDQPDAFQLSEELAAVFDPSSADGYQRRYTISVAPKSEECYFVQGMQEGQKLNFHFMVWKSYYLILTNHGIGKTEK